MPPSRGGGGDGIVKLGSSRIEPTTASGSWSMVHCFETWPVAEDRDMGLARLYSGWRECHAVLVGWIRGSRRITRNSRYGRRLTSSSARGCAYSYPAPANRSPCGRARNIRAPMLRAPMRQGRVLAGCSVRYGTSPVSRPISARRGSQPRLPRSGLGRSSIRQTSKVPSSAVRVPGRSLQLSSLPLRPARPVSIPVYASVDTSVVCLSFLRPLIESGH